MKSSDPVILKLEGGLGNQLFELAAGYYLAAKLETDLHLDQYSIPLTTVHSETKNGFAQFQIHSLPKGKEILYLGSLPSKFLMPYAKRINLLKRVLIKLRMTVSNRQRLPLFIETNEEQSIKDFFMIDFPVKLHGNFQSWEVVEKAAQLGFPRIFSLEQVPVWITKLESEIDFRNSAVLHFRVGDDTRTNYNFKQPEIIYYLQALDVLKEKKKISSTYILSDDIPRVKEMFGNSLGGDLNYLEMPVNSSPAERLYVLSLFGGIVCANSTFCGWAAWSIYNSGGEVVVPVPYSDGPVLGSRDFPSKWIQLDKYSGVAIG